MWIGIPEEEDVLVFSDAAFRATHGKASYGFLVKSKGFILHASACQGPKVSSSKVAEARAVFFALMIAKAKGFPKVCILLDAKEEVGESKLYFGLGKGLGGNG